MVEAFAEMGERPLLQGASRQLAEVGFGPRFEDQGIGDPAHAVGAGQHAHLGLTVEQRQAYAVLDGEVARLGGMGQFAEFLQYPVAVALDEGLDLRQRVRLRRADAQAAFVDGHRQPLGAALQAVVDDAAADQQVAGLGLRRAARAGGTA
jgi:hypothetical protein